MRPGGLLAGGAERGFPPPPSRMCWEVRGHPSHSLPGNHPATRRGVSWALPWKCGENGSAEGEALRMGTRLVGLPTAALPGAMPRANLPSGW